MSEDTELDSLSNESLRHEARKVVLRSLRGLQNGRLDPGKRDAHIRVLHAPILQQLLFDDKL